eukprot:jgi/Astpho2/9819/Aster-x1611
MTSNTAAEPGAATRATRPSSSLEWPPQLLEELPEEAAVLAGDYAANEAAEKLVADTVDAMFATEARDLQELAEKIRRPGGYVDDPVSNRKLLDEDKLKVYRDAMKLLEQQLKHDLPAGGILDFNTRRDMKTQLSRLKTFLAPLMQGNRYSSYGRHFTMEEKLKIVARKLATFLENGDLVVDFSCGANAWIPEVKKTALELMGTRVSGKAFDIVTPACMEDFTLQDWFATSSGHDPAKMIIGLNPPFGYNNSLANAFARHAAKLQPRLIVLIVPPETLVPDGYIKLCDERTVMEHRSFYVPGTGQQSWNVTAPSLRFLARRDLVRKVTEVEQWTWCLLPPEAEHNAWPQQIHYQHQKQHQSQLLVRHQAGAGRGQGLAKWPSSHP